MIKQHLANNMKIGTTTVTQTANELLNTKEKTLYYLIVESVENKLVINVGEKTHSEVKKLMEEEEKYNKLTPEEKKKEDARIRAKKEANK